jgi:dissimilatory sulfite reductase related protein
MPAKAGAARSETKWVGSMELADLAGLSEDPNRQYRLIGGRRVYFDSDGFLWDSQDWSEELAEMMASEGGLGQLGETHWKVLRFIREFYLSNGRAPRNRPMRESTGLTMREIEGLFPGGIKLGALRFAGLPASIKRNCE